MSNTVKLTAEWQNVEKASSHYGDIITVTTNAATKNEAYVKSMELLGAQCSSEGKNCAEYLCVSQNYEEVRR